MGFHNFVFNFPFCGFGDGNGQDYDRDDNAACDKTPGRFPCPDLGQAGP